jgi:hypothetical protein
MVPELTASVGVPRIAAIEHPFGLTLGLPGDAARQLAVLRGALRALEEISQPGDVTHLPFGWDSGNKLNMYPPEPPPIARYLRRHPWHFPKFVHRMPPELPSLREGNARGGTESGGEHDGDEQR